MPAWRCKASASLRKPCRDAPTSSVSLALSSVRLRTPSVAGEQPKAQQIAVNSVLLPLPVVQWGTLELPARSDGRT